MHNLVDYRVGISGEKNFVRFAIAGRIAGGSGGIFGYLSLP